MASVERRRADRAKRTERALRDTTLTDRCPACGKMQYTSRSRAKTAAKSLMFRGEKMSVYRCPDSRAGIDVWHVGHMASDVAAGELTRNEVYFGAKFEPEPTPTLPLKEEAARLIREKADRQARERIRREAEREYFKRRDIERLMRPGS